MKDVRKIKDRNDINTVISENPEKLVIVKFQSTWCGPCQVLRSTMTNLPDDETKNVILLEADVDEAEQLSEEFGIRSIPALFFFKGNEKEFVEKTVGLLTRDTLLEKIKNHLG